MGDFLSFRKMITPIIIQILFWIGCVVCVIAGLVTMATSSGPYGSSSSALGGLLLIVLGPLAVRVYCELLIVLFRMNETLTDIRSAMLTRPPGPASSRL